MGSVGQCGSRLCGRMSWMSTIRPSRSMKAIDRGNEGVLHPETVDIRFAQFEQHAVVGRQRGPVHQPFAQRLGRGGVFDPDRVAADMQRYGRQRRPGRPRTWGQRAGQQQGGGQHFVEKGKKTGPARGPASR